MADHLERIGQTMGDYRLMHWLGGGGFGNVYLAEHTHHGEQVALKVLEIRLTKSEDFRVFLNEARTIRLRHLHIVPLLDFGLSRENMPFLVMEYAPQGTLRDHHPKGSRVPLPTVIEYATQVASALHYAHAQRMVHRDVKPENMLVRADGAILLSDFGIATTAHSTHSLSASQGIGGTIPYMAPEQLEGQPRTESDQYALGIVIYEWLAGCCPFRGTAVEVAMQHAMKQPPSLLKQVPGLPQAVEEVLFKALAKNPKGRFASMQAFLQALQQASGSLPTLHKLSDESFPKAVSLVAPSPAIPQPPVIDLPIQTEHSYFQGHEEQSITPSLPIQAPPLLSSSASYPQQDTPPVQPLPLAIPSIQPTSQLSTPDFADIPESISPSVGAGAVVQPTQQQKPLSISGRTLLIVMPPVALLTWGGLLLFTSLVPAQGMLVFIIFYLLLGLAVTSTCSIIIYLIRLLFPKVRRAGSVANHAMREAILFAIYIIFNLLLRLFHNWNIFMALISLGIIIIIDMFLIWRK